MTILSGLAGGQLYLRQLFQSLLSKSLRLCCNGVFGSLIAPGWRTYFADERRHRFNNRCFLRSSAVKFEGVAVFN
jgi:hypothetical protein